MMAAAKKYYRALLFAALLAMVPPGSAFAQQTIQVATTADVRALLGQAENLLAAGNVQRAYELLQGRETELSGHAYFDYLLGVAALDSGRINEAILSLRRAATTAPQFSGARMELARAHFDAGEKNVARPIFVALLAENPPPGVRGVLDQYIAAIDTRPETPASRFDPYLELFVGDDDNANGSTSDQQFLGFTLDAENLATESAFYER